jgi:hypothetical protein
VELIVIQIVGTLALLFAQGIGEIGTVWWASLLARASAWRARRRGNTESGRRPVVSATPSPYLAFVRSEQSALAAPGARSERLSCQWARNGESHSEPHAVDVRFKHGS